jgi:GT2 family glycosyltransferase
MEASIIIPTKDKFSRLRLTLQAMESQISENVEVIIVCDGCFEETIDNIKNLELSFEPKLVISKKNIGRAAARNLGIRNAQGKIIIFNDDDRIPGADFINKHIFGHQNKRCVLVGMKKYLNYTEDAINSFFETNAVKNNFKQIISNVEDDHIDRVRQVILRNQIRRFWWITFHTANLSVEREDLFNVGLFDEKFIGWGWEDHEIGYRFFKRNICFVEDPTLENYHLNHPINEKEKYIQEFENYRYLKSLNLDMVNRIFLSLWRLRNDYLFRKKHRLSIKNLSDVKRTALNN